MKHLNLFILTLLIGFTVTAQQKSTDTTRTTGLVLIPYQPMMYFSDADPDLARASHLSEQQVRTDMMNNLTANLYHQLLAKYEVHDLSRATSMDGQTSLKHIYAATRYTPFSPEQKREYHEQIGYTENAEAKSLVSSFAHKSKDQLFWVSDSSVMLGAIQTNEIFKELHKKFNEKYILFITQFELNTSNKNTIEWTTQTYERVYTLHYNLFDANGRLIRAESIHLKGGNENRISDINSKYLIVLAQRIKEIISATDN